MVTGIRRRFFVALSLLGLVISTLVVVGVAPAAGATTFVVDTTVDDGALNGCTLAPGDCSLRGAIAKANTTVGADTIDFLIPGVQCPGGVCPITLTEGPLTITEAVTIDATTQVQNGGPQANVCATETEPSYMRIELVVDPTGADGNGFVVNYTGGPTTIRGFAIGTNFNGSGFWSGIDTYDGSGHHIACNHLGLDAAGTSQLGSEDFDAMVAVDGYADGVIIGTDGDGNNDIAERNVFGSDGYGIYINGNTNNRISGNYFGFTPDGTSTISSGSVYMRQDSSNNLVGVDGDGVSDDIEVNYFGNAYASIIITTGTYVTTGNEIVGNVIGMGPTGTTATSTRGISVASDVAFSGYEIRDNTILGAVQHTIVADAPGSGLLIDGNLIGVTADGTAGANGTGIGLNGTTSPQLSGNFIANSSSSGVQLADTATLAAGSTGNCVVGNTAGVTNSTGTSVNFENNWWGAIDGPSGSGPGSGDTVSADVDYDPWSTSPGALCNTAPVADDATFTIAEDAAVGTTVGTVTATDDGATLAYAIAAGNGAGKFTIDDATGEITTAAALDFETTPSYSLTVEVSDGQYADTATITIDVTNAAEGPTFTDVPQTHTFYGDIEWLAAEGITKGCNPPDNDMFCPTNPVTRGQMAAFLHRALGGTLTPGAAVTFTDIDGLAFEADIEWLGSVGVTKGCNPPDNDMYCPANSVTRGQMAAFLVRALGYTAGAGSDRFTDDDGSVFEADIERLAEAGVTKGCNPPENDMFCPNAPVTRAQMAAFLHRALGD